MSQQNKTKNLKGWLQRTICFENIEYGQFLELFYGIIENNGFNITKKTDLDGGVSIEAIYGSKIIALLTNLIPIIGHHIPWGKRLGLKASILNGSSIEININISPYMELFNTTEVFILSQSATEKASDEYFVAHKIHKITQELHFGLNLPVPDEFSEFNKKAFVGDIFLSYLIYPLDGYKSLKTIHIPLQKGPKWSWAAFIIPEFWFIWHEIWGVSILAILIEFYGSYKLISYGAPFEILYVIAFLIRIISGRIGNIMYFYKYGRWINNKFPSYKKSVASDKQKEECAKGAEASDKQEKECAKEAEEWLKKASKPMNNILKF